jgi:hypothetical protein
MKTTNILYWVFTGIFAALMIFSSVDNVGTGEQSVALISNMLQFPKYMIPFLGVAKLLGVIGILIPQLPRWIKEWSYAGLFFDLAGATYAMISVSGGFKAEHLGMLMFFVPGVLSYIWFHKKFGAA